MRSPFDFEHADPWSSDLIDVESLNRHVSDLIVQRVADVREAAEQGPNALRTTSLLALGPAGSGKTHLFVRIRRKCGPRAAFVLIRPELGVDTSPRHVLNVVVDALGQHASSTTDRQLDVVVASMLAKFIDESGPHVLLTRFRDASVANREELLARGMDELERRFPEAYFPYLEQLLRAPFLASADRRAATQWLSGREPSDASLQRLGLPGGLADADIIPALRTLSIVASFGAPIVLVFDQLENLFDPDSAAHRVHNHANLVSELFDSVRGLVVVQLALEGEWRGRIRLLLSDSQRSRLESTVLELELPSNEQREQLVRAWVARLPEAERVRPFPYPFSKSLLDEWRLTEGLTPRRLMIACREAMLAGPSVELENVSSPVEAVPNEDAVPDRLAQLWEIALADARRQLTAVAAEGRGLDGDEVVAGLLSLFHVLPGARAKSKRIKNVSALEVEQNGAASELRAVQHLHPRAVGAAIQHAHEAAAKTKQVRVLVVRERALPFATTWKKVEEHARTLQAAGGALLWLEHEESAQLVALHDFLSAARSQDLTHSDGSAFDLERVEEWLRASASMDEWSLVQRIFGAAAEEAIEPAASHTRSKVPIRADELVSATGPVLALLKQLRVASVERLVRELREKQEASSDRSQVIQELRAAADRVRWFGRSIVAWNGGPR